MREGTTRNSIQLSALARAFFLAAVAITGGWLVLAPIGVANAQDPNDPDFCPVGQQCGVTMDIPTNCMTYGTVTFCDRSPYWERGFRTVAEPAAPVPTADDFPDSEETGTLSGDDPNNQGCKVCGNPFNILTGNKVQREFDYVGTGRMPLVFSRTFNSKAPATQQSPLGTKWSMGIPTLEKWWTTLYEEPGGIWFGMILIREDGQRVKFKSADGPLLPGTTNVTVEFTRTNGKVERLFQADDGTWVYLDRTMEYRFDTYGRITLKIDRPTGEYHKYTYPAGLGRDPSQITHSSGRSLTLTYSNGQLTTLADPAGKQIQYTYNAQGNLASVTYPAVAAGTPTRTYHYENTQFPDLLTKIVDEVGTQSKWTYDSSGNALSSETNTGIDKFEVLSRTAANGVWEVRTKNALGRESTHRFEEIGGRKKATSTDGDATTYCAATSSNITYDSMGYYDKLTDAEGNVTDYNHDSNGRLSSITEAFGTTAARTTTFIYNHDTELLEFAGNSEQETFYDYGLPNEQGQGRLKSIRRKDLTGTSVDRVTTFTYPAVSTTAEGTELVRQVFIDGPQSGTADTTKVFYDSAGRLASTLNAEGHLTIFGGNYDALGRPLQITHPTGMVTNLVYNDRGWLTSKTDVVQTRSIGGGTYTQNRTTTYTHRLDGTVSKITFPDSTELIFGYDLAGRLASVSGPGLQWPERIAFEYDNASNITRERRQAGFISPIVHKEVNYEYDALSRLRKVTDGNNYEQLITYDKNDLVDLVTDARNNTTQHIYNERNELTQMLNRDSGQVDMVYDDNSLLNAVTDAINVTTNYTRNGFGEVTTESSPDSGTWNYVYDEAGNLQKVTDAKGHDTDYQNYDALNRLGVIKHPDLAGDTTFSYDQSQPGYMDRVTDYTGYTDFEYNQAGELTKKTAHVVGVTMTIEYQYDASGRVEHAKMPGGTELFYTYDDYGRVERIEVDHSDPLFARQDLASNIQYKPFGPMTQVVLGSLQTRTLTYDNNYQLQTLTSGSVMQKSYGYDANGNITTITDGLGAPLRTYGYDTMDRLDQHSGPDGVFDYRYDKNGNRESKNSPTDNYAYYSDTNRLQSAPEFTVAYDANGIATQRGSLLFGVNHRHRIWQVVSAGPTYNNYFYNSLGERVYKYVHNGTFNQRFVYGGGLLLHEQGSQGTIDYVYLNGQPIAMVKDGSIFYLHTDHLGRPEVATNWSGVVAWSIEANAWSSDGIAGGLTVNLRFPGQYYDAESGLHYNYSRFYDPVIARYLSSDPIGLRGGLNRYNYANGNPLSFVDQLGLSAAAAEVQRSADWARRIRDLARCARTAVATIRAGAAASAAPGAVLVAGMIIPSSLGDGTISDHEWEQRRRNGGTITLPDGGIGSTGTYENPIQSEDSVEDLWVSMAKPPSDAKDPEGAKAPGKPGELEGFKDPKGGEDWVKNPNGRGNGWKDDKGRVWVPTGHGGSAHGGPHWDVQDPRTGDATNVYPGGRKR